MSSPPHPAIIALDGPAGSGKTSTARAVAERLGFVYLDTGAMYRAVTLAALDAGAPITDDGLAGVLDATRLEIGYGEGRMAIRLNGEDVSDRIRSGEVGRHVSPVSALASVRHRMVDMQRAFARAQLVAGRGIVVDGRDIGTVVFPDAELKVFMSAQPRVRAARRHQELAQKGDERSLDDVLAEIERRDAMDSARAIAPLRPAEDAILLDTSGLTMDQQVSFVVNKLSERQQQSDV
ncbi:MAG: (d)CMP kinase [Rhodothermales bacterium]